MHTKSQIGPSSYRVQVSPQWFTNILWLIWFLITVPLPCKAQTFANGPVDFGDGSSNIFSAADTGPDGNFYVLWKDGNFYNTTTLATPKYKLIRWNPETSTWTTLSTILANTATFPNIITSEFTTLGDRMGLKVDSQGRFHIVFHIYRTTGAAIMYGISGNGSSWTFTTLETNNNTTNYSLSDPQIDLDTSDRPHVVFRVTDNSSSDPTQRPTRIRRHFYNGTSWAAETVYSRLGSLYAINAGVGYAIDSSGKGHLAIAVETNGSGTDASLFYLNNTSGTWSTPVNLAAGATSNAAVISLDLAVDTSDKVHVVRRDLAYNLHYHTNSAGTWVGGQINGNLQGNIDYDSLAVNSVGDVLLAYNAHTGTNTGSVRYACLFKGESAWQSGSVMSGNSRTGQYFSVAFKGDRTAMLLFDHFTGTGSPAYANPDNPRQLQYATATITPPSSPPVLAASSVSGITTTSSIIAGEVLSDGGASISERGVVFAATLTNANPQIGGNGVIKTLISGTTGAFSGEVTGLTQNTSYSFRTYAINSAGTTYSAIGSFTTLEELTSIQKWRKLYYGDKNSVGNGADLAEPDGDGIANLLKYALNIVPGGTGLAGLPKPHFVNVNGSNYLAISVTRVPTRNDVTIHIEAGDDLIGWTEVGSSINGAAFTGLGFVSETDADGGNKLAVIRDTENSNAAPRRFMRVRVSY